IDPAWNAIPRARRSAHREFDVTMRDHGVRQPCGHVYRTGRAILERRSATTDLVETRIAGRDARLAGHQYQAGLTSRVTAGMALAIGELHQLEADMRPAGALRRHRQHGAVGVGGVRADTQA